MTPETEKEDGEERENMTTIKNIGPVRSILLLARRKHEMPTTPSMEFARLQEVVDLLQERQLGVLQLELLLKRY